jgi:tRNA(fMet)-specific endonuclease VapC
MLDANVLMHVANRATGYVNILEKFAEHSGQIGLSAVVAFELHHKLIRQKVRKVQIEALRRAVFAFPVADFSLAAAQVSAEIRAALEAAGQPISNLDSMIAGHAKVAGVVLVTDNERELRRVKGLAIENWRRPSF